MLESLAYIDPGTGSLLLQMLLAVIVSIGIVFRRIFISPFYAIVNLFKKSKPEVSSDKSKPEVPPDDS